MKSNKRPFFSIITVTLNNQLGLLDTLMSIMQQLEQDLEWIVVDGGSSDGTVEFLKKITHFPVEFISEPDNGIYDAMNKGICMATGKYLLFLNAGDVFPDPNILNKVRDVAICDADLIFGGATLTFPKKPEKKPIYRAPRRLESFIWYGLPANHQAIYFNRDFLGEIRYNLKYKITADYHLVARLHKMGAKVVYIDKPLVNYLVGGVSYIYPIKAIIESYMVQRDVLKISLSIRLLNLLIRAYFTFSFKYIPVKIDRQVVEFVKRKLNIGCLSNETA